MSLYDILLKVQRGNDGCHDRCDYPGLMIADILELKRRARADLALEARASVDDGVVAEEGEGDEEGCEWEGGGAAEGGDGDKGLDADRRDGQDAVDF